MSAINEKELDHIAKLARIELAPAEKARLSQELDSILGYISKLNELDTEGVEPTSQVTGLENVFRGDELAVNAEYQVVKLLEAMPDKKDRYLKVKSVLNKNGR